MANGMVGAPTRWKTVTCEKCGAQIGATYYSRHLRNCKGIAKGRA